MAFNIMPIELNEHIAGYLPSDRDVASFVAVCHATHAAAESHRCGLWRKLFARRFDVPTGASGQELKLKYMVRAKVLNGTTNWITGNDKNEKTVLAVLHDLVIESYTDVAPSHNAMRISKNLLALRCYKNTSNILDNVLLRLERSFNPHLRTLQLVLTHLQFDLRLSPLTKNFQYSQKMVYEHPKKYPLFKAKHYSKVDIDFLMHTVNFFKHHMTTFQVDTLREIYCELEDHERPKAWDARLHQGPGVKSLGKHWLGSYAYLDNVKDMRRIRSKPVTSHQFTDSIDFEDGFQTLDLDFSAAANNTPWPKEFEAHLNGMPPVALCKQLDDLQKRVLRRPDLRSKSTKLDLGVGFNNQEMLKTPPPTPGVQRQTITFPIPDKITPLSAPPTPAATSPKRGIHYHQFNGSGTDAEPFHCNGILHPLPPQHGIPGWQRITLMKYFEDPLPDSASSASAPFSNASSSAPSSHSSTTTSTSSSSSAASTTSFTPINAPPHVQSDLDVDIMNGCWAYEGVVLPGGKIIAGRWWSPLQDPEEMTCMGPFIFWEVDREA